MIGAHPGQRARLSTPMRVAIAVIVVESLIIAATGAAWWVEHGLKRPQPESTEQALALLSTSDVVDHSIAMGYLMDRIKFDPKAADLVARTAWSTSDEYIRRDCMQVLDLAISVDAVRAMRELLRHDSTAFAAASDLARGGNDAGKAILERIASDHLDQRSEEASRALADLSSMPTVPSLPTK